MPIALLSVSDKRGIVELGRELVARGWEVVSTGGTARALREGGVPVTAIRDLTGFPEMLGGRVKTLHPAVHGGLLARRSVPEDMREMEQLGLRPIDLVAVNLYPFRRTAAEPGTTLAEALEQIDIGGPTLLRAAAKNHADVWPVCDPDDYPRVLAALDERKEAAELRRKLAAKVFWHTAGYDGAIASYLGGGSGAGAPEEGTFPEDLLVPLVRVRSLRYGENPDQQAALYRTASGEGWGIPGLEQLHGKELSYNNLLDLDAALTALGPFLGAGMAACAILKHTTPCGMALGRNPREAYDRARACDPVSAFGSVVAFNQPVTEAAAETLVEGFVECILAPGYAAEALRILRKKKNLRILAPSKGGRPFEADGHLWSGLEARGVRGGVLLQTAPDPAGELRANPDVTVPTEREPSDREWEDLSFAWSCVQVVKSNGILLAREGATVGIGAGQMSRVDAVRLAVWKAEEAGHSTEAAVLASDAFFPFRDGVDAAAAAGVTAVVQPGGSIRDAEVIDAANEHGMAMVFTHRRLFRH